MYVIQRANLTHMKKTQVYLPDDELEALCETATRSGRSVAALIRDAIRQVVLKPATDGPVALWDGQPRRVASEHDSVRDDP
jgi:hypothetical protein